MAAALLRELAIAGRSIGFAAALFGHVALLAAFVLLWADAGGMALAGAPVFHVQYRTVEMVALAVILPWGIARSLGVRDADEIARLAVVGAQAPSRLLAAKLLAACLFSTIVALSALPISIVVHQMFALSLGRALFDSVSMAVFGIMAAAITCACIGGVHSRLRGWVIATAVSLAVLAAARLAFADDRAMAVYGAVALLAAALPVRRADVRLLYLSENQT